MGQHKIWLTVQEKYLDDVTSIDAVQLIKEVHKVELCNGVARTIVSADVGVSNTKYKDDGKAAIAADTGFATGARADTHPTFTVRV